MNMILCLVKVRVLSGWLDKGFILYYYVSESHRCIFRLRHHLNARLLVVGLEFIESLARVVLPWGEVHSTL